MLSLSLACAVSVWVGALCSLLAILLLVVRLLEMRVAGETPKGALAVKASAGSGSGSGTVRAALSLSLPHHRPRGTTSEQQKHSRSIMAATSPRRFSLVASLDVGVDDALGLLLALSSPDIELLALVPQFGNTDLSFVHDNVLKLYGVLDRHFEAVPAD